MAAEKTGRIKIYVVIGLSFVLAASGYFRIIRPKVRSAAPPDASASIGSPASIAGPVRIPRIPMEAATKRKPNRTSFSIEPIHSIRDIFAEPPAPETREKKEPERPKPPPTQLKGTIVGGDDPIAIINGRFLRIGDWIDDYQLLQIEKDRVRLRSGKDDVVLEVFKNANP